ncbi:hypothetical protein [Bosea sp. FBZP-16]|uniref:hypothetical protein n=1 Tax=Bosea sp. FBZP-16 TaxID=2065382 RepID=UPI000C310C12|nr:hypothetical protein [Bosea sp. FBZP-16]
MSAFDDLDEGGFTALAPTAPKFKADVKLSFVTFKPTTPAKLQISFKAEVLAEIGGPRFEIGWNAVKRLLLVKAKDQGPFEAASAPRGKTLLLRMPPPAGIVANEEAVEPEYYVDAIGKRLLIEVPVEFGRRLALPAPAQPKPDAPKGKPTQIPAAEVEAGNREILRALGVTENFPREIGGVKFQPAEARSLEALYRGKELTMEALLAATHDPENGDDDREVKIVDVWLCKMRPKLAELDLVVKTIWGGKRALDATSKGILRALLREAGARV